MSKGVIGFVIGVVVVLVGIPLIGHLMGDTESDSTGGTPSAVSTDGTPSAVSTDGTPSIVRMSPPNSATDVDPSMTVLEIKFNMPMGGGFSWTTRGQKDKFPEGTGKPSWSSDKKTCMMPVKLYPNRSYVIGVNSRSAQNFRSASGVPVPMVTWTFTTAGS